MRVPDDTAARSYEGGDDRAMPRMSLFNSPFLLGFEQFEQTLDRISKMSAEGYPPYNIEQVDTNSLRITLAVAGFTESDLSIELEDNQLLVRGRQEDETDRVYLHRGIAARQFQRSFVLAEGIEIVGAELDSGLLHIDLVRSDPEPRVQTIKIKQRSPRSEAMDVTATAGSE